MTTNTTKRTQEIEIDIIIAAGMSDHCCDVTLSPTITLTKARSQFELFTSCATAKNSLIEIGNGCSFVVNIPVELSKRNKLQ